MQEVNDKIFITKWLSSLIAVWYICMGLYIHNPYVLEIIFWPLHTHNIEIDVIESTVDWKSYIDKLDRDLEIGYLYPPIKDDGEVEIIEDVIEIRKLDKWIKTEK